MVSLETSNSHTTKENDVKIDKDVLTQNADENNPNIISIANYIITIINYDWLLVLINEFMTPITEAELDANPDLYLDQLVEVLAEVEDAFDKVEDIMRQVSRAFYTSWIDHRMAKIEPDYKKIQKFESAESLKAVLQYPENNKYPDIFSLIGERECDLLQAVLVCEMMGHDKSATTLKKEFTDRIFLHSNELYSLILLIISKIYGQKQSVREAGKTGNDVRHRINREVKNKAIELYFNGTFHNPRHAAKLLLPEVAKIASQLGSNLEWSNNGFDRLYQWLRVAAKTKRM